MTTFQVGSMVFPESAPWGWYFHEIEGWDSTSDNKVKATERPRNHGAFRRRKVVRSSLPVTLKAAFIGADWVDLKAAKLRLNSMAAESLVTMSELTPIGTFSREVTIENIDIPDDFERFVTEGIAIDMLAHDPRKYGPIQTATTELPAAGTGLVWPITYPIDWGQPGSGGKITLTNKGLAPTVPTFRAKGGLAPGTTITEAGTGKRLTLDRIIPDGEVVKFDGRTRRVTLNGVADVSAGFLTRREWMTVEAGQTATYLFSGTALSGTPTLTGELQSAWW